MERVSANLAIDLSVRVANTRAAWLHTMRLMLDRGLVTEADLASMRATCLDAAAEFAIGGEGLPREIGIAGMRDMDALLAGVTRQEPPR